MNIHQTNAVLSASYLASYACPENPVSLPENYSLSHADILF